MKLWRRKVRTINGIVERLNNDGVPHPRGYWSWHGVRRRMILLGLLACPTCGKRACTPKPKLADLNYRRKRDDGTPGVRTPEQRERDIAETIAIMKLLGFQPRQGSVEEDGE